MSRKWRRDAARRLCSKEMAAAYLADPRRMSTSPVNPVLGRYGNGFDLHGKTYGHATERRARVRKLVRKARASEGKRHGNSFEFFSLVVTVDRLSVASKIRGSTLRFCPGPPVFMRPSARKGPGALLQSDAVAVFVVRELACWTRSTALSLGYPLGRLPEQAQSSRPMMMSTIRLFCC